MVAPSGTGGQNNSAQTKRPVTAKRRLTSINLDLRGLLISVGDMTVRGGDMRVSLGATCLASMVNGSLMAGGLGQPAGLHCEADHT